MHPLLTYCIQPDSILLDLRYDMLDDMDIRPSHVCPPDGQRHHADWDWFTIIA